jgi:6-pyruvoyltetrahydropterin/6-carboxytetrahydropterin synthase
MPLVHLTRRVHFNAAHRLHNPNKSDEWNREMFGLCNNPNWHGHNYILEVTLKGKIDPETGYLFDLSELKRVMNEQVADRCDHRNLNLDVDFLEGIMPSTENLVIAFWKELEKALPQGMLHCVHLIETERNSASYYGE